MKILNISAVLDPESGSSIIYGLADDGKVYVWNRGLETWIIESNKRRKVVKQQIQDDEQKEVRN